VKSRFCLTSSSDFKRVRRFGKSYAHPLVVLVVHPNQLEVTRFGVTASRSLGGAVQRNRAKRRLRAAQHLYQGELTNGWDLIWIAREPLLHAPFAELQTAMTGLLKRAGLLDKSYGFAFPPSTGAA
jgi:ribonuclease P protein component